LSLVVWRSCVLPEPFIGGNFQRSSGRIDQNQARSTASAGFFVADQNAATAA
jgi:hypothetical protein